MATSDEENQRTYTKTLTYARFKITHVIKFSSICVLFIFLLFLPFIKKCKFFI